MIELCNVTKSYCVNNQKMTIIDQLSMKFPNVGMVCILGKSGSGKSTLLNLLGAIDRLDSGDLLIDGESTAQKGPDYWDWYRRSRVGFVFQEHLLVDELTVGENIALALHVSNHSITDKKIAVDKVLGQVDLSDYANRNVQELSGGEKQRVSIARAIIHQPDILLADEPTGNLDSKTGNEIWGLLKQLSLHHLVIIVTHDEVLSECFADRIYRLHAGKLQTIRENASILPSFEDSSPVNVHSSRHSMPIRVLVKLALRNMEYKKKRLFFVFTMFLMSMLLLSVSFALLTFDYGTVSFHSLEANEISKVLFLFENDCEDQDCLSQNQTVPGNVERLVGLYPTIEMNLYLAHSIPMNRIEGYEEIPEVYLNWYTNQLDGIEVLSSINTLSLLGGSLPNDAFEIALTDYLVEMMRIYGITDVTNPIDLIDSIFRFSINDLRYEYRVSGILQTDYESYITTVDDEGNRIVPVDQLDRFQKEVASSFSHLFLSEEGYTAFQSATFAIPVVMSTFDYQMFFYSVADVGAVPVEKIFGSIPSTSSEFIISVSQLLGIEEITSEQYFADQSFYQTKWMGQTLALQSVSEIPYDVEEQYTIVGIYDDVSDSGIHTLANVMYLSSNVFDAFYANYETTIQKGIVITLHYETNEADLMNDLLEDGYEHKTHISGSLKSIYHVTTQLRMLILALFGFFLVFVALILHSFFSMTIEYRHKQIGILRTLGYTRKEATLVFMWESAWITSAVVVLAIPLSFVIDVLIRTTIRQAFDQDLVLFQMDWMRSLVMVAMAYFISMGSTWITIRKATKKDPILELRG